MNATRGNKRPETQWDSHRPAGHPQPRESHSQAKRHGSDGMLSRSADRDGDLTKAVQKVISSDANLEGYGLKAGVIDGTARVSGVVDTLAEKKHLDALVRDIPGIKGYEDGVSISTDGQVLDSHLEMEVAEEIAADENITSQVEIRVKDGIAYLSGNVRSDEEEKAAVHAASKARGITGVTSHITTGETNDDMASDELFHSQVRNDEESGDDRSWNE